LIHKHRFIRPEFSVPRKTERGGGGQVQEFARSGCRSSVATGHGVSGLENVVIFGRCSRCPGLRVLADSVADEIGVRSSSVETVAATPHRYISRRTVSCIQVPWANSSLSPSWISCIILLLIVSSQRVLRHFLPSLHGRCFFSRCFVSRPSLRVGRSSRFASLSFNTCSTP